jgi:hypothetical protein
MKTIPLTQGMVALVDDEDYADLAQFKWYARKSPKDHTYYAARNVKQAGRQITERMHRRILNAQVGQIVDHENHNGLDCQRHNIRICTQRQNNGNRRRNIHSSSRFKGVTWYGRYKKWRAQIQNNGKEIHLGYFDDEEQAAHAYDKKAIELFGEFACLNFPERKAA